MHHKTTSREVNTPFDRGLQSTSTMASLGYQHGLSDETLPREETSEQYHPQHSSNEPNKSGHIEMKSSGEPEEDSESNVELSAPSTNIEAPEKDPNLVWWDGPDDPHNPMNWPRSKKWIVTITFAAMTVWITLTTSVFSATTLVIAKEFGVSTNVTTLGMSLPIFVCMPECHARLGDRSKFDMTPL